MEEAEEEDMQGAEEEENLQEEDLQEECMQEEDVQDEGEEEKEEEEEEDEEAEEATASEREALGQADHRLTNADFNNAKEEAAAANLQQTASAFRTVAPAAVVSKRSTLADPPSNIISTGVRVAMSSPGPRAQLAVSDGATEHVSMRISSRQEFDDFMWDRTRVTPPATTPWSKVYQGSLVFSQMQDTDCHYIYKLVCHASHRIPKEIWEQVPKDFAAENISNLCYDIKTKSSRQWWRMYSRYHRAAALQASGQPSLDELTPAAASAAPIASTSPGG